MNAIYARPDGEIVDPLDGVEDLQERRIRFIGTAENRIREDYLRSLRYFRFYAWYGDHALGFDPDALAAIAANLEGLATLSKERVGAEMLKLLAAPDPVPSAAAMLPPKLQRQQLSAEKHVSFCSLAPSVADALILPVAEVQMDRQKYADLPVGLICDCGFPAIKWRNL